MSIKESDTLYMSQSSEGGLVGFEASQKVERGPTSTRWAWDAEFFDFDHAGDDDLYVVNGASDYNFFKTIYRHQGEDGNFAEYQLSDSPLGQS